MGEKKERISKKRHCSEQRQDAQEGDQETVFFSPHHHHSYSVSFLKPCLSFYMLTFLVTNKCTGEVTLVFVGCWVLPRNLGAGFRM